MSMTVYDLTGLPLMEQAKKIYTTSSSATASMIKDLWPKNTPQRQLFFEINFIPYSGNPRTDEEFNKLVHFALYDAATKMGKECRAYITTIAKQEDSELIKKYMKDFLGDKQQIKKEKVDTNAFSASTLSLAAEYYDRIASMAMPELKKQKLQFKGDMTTAASSGDSAQMLAGSIFSHNLIRQTYKVIGGEELRLIEESARCMPTYITEAYNVSIKDIKDYEDLEVLTADNGNLRWVPFKHIISQWEEG